MIIKFNYNDKKEIYDAPSRSNMEDRIKEVCQKIEDFCFRDHIFAEKSDKDTEYRFSIHSTAFQGAAESLCSSYEILNMKRTINLYPERIKMIASDSNIDEENASLIEQLLFEYYIARELFYCINGALFKPLTSQDDEKKMRSFLFFGSYFAICYIDDIYGKKKRDLLLYIIFSGGSDLLFKICKERGYNHVLTAVVDGTNLLRYGIKKYEGKNLKGNDLKYYKNIYNAYVNGNYSEDGGVCELLDDLRDGKRTLSEYEFQTLRNTTSLDLYNENDQLKKNALEFIYQNAVCDDGNRKRIDEDLLCLFHSIRRFTETGSKYDAFDVYCCYTDKYLVGDKLQTLINFISSYENNASRLVQSHRDHYSHSVYVFILGLAIYKTNRKVREAFKNTYKITSSFSEHMAGDYSHEPLDAKFIRLWGLTALFHDIGYQFEIPFCQIKENENNAFLYGDNIRTIFFQYQNMDKFTELKNFLKSCELGVWKIDDLMHYDDDYLYYISALVNDDNEAEKVYIEDIIAWHIERRLNRSIPVKRIAELLKSKPIPKDNVFNKKKMMYEAFMDHAYYSAILIFKQMIRMFGPDRFMDNRVEDSYYREKMADKYSIEKKYFVLNEWMDAITAIVMHNKFFEFNLKDINNKGPLKLEEHPLAYLLILCDELQCWDRTAFGKKSITELHAMDCKFSFNESNSEGISASYIFDINGRSNALGFDENSKISYVKDGTLQKFFKYGKEYLTPECINQNDESTWKIDDAYFGGGRCKFSQDIAEIIDLDSGNGVTLKVDASFANDTRQRSEYLSESSMRELYNMAEELYENTKSDDADDFKYTDGTEKLLYIQFVKNIGKCLHRIGCFYSNQPKALDRVIGFSDEEKKTIIAEQKKDLNEFSEQHLQKTIDEEHLKKMVDEFEKNLIEKSGVEVYRI